MTDLQSWVLHTAILTILIGVSESWVERFRLAKAAQWLMRLILLGQLLIPIDALIRWLKGGL